MEKVISIARNFIPQTSHWRDYLELCKPRVVALMLLTAYVGMQLSVTGMIPLDKLFFGMLGIASAAGSAAVINHLLDRRIDALMARTKRRPIADGRITPQQALVFALLLAMFSIVILLNEVNLLAALLTTLTLLGYAVVYTVYLKRATPQNIVIGGVAGAAPPLLGWVAVTGQLHPYAWLLVLIIFAWTPPHFWALAIYRHQEYAKADIPMLPVTHGIKFTKLCILLYTFLLCATTIFPFVVGMSGWVYLIGSSVLNLGFIYYSLLLINKDELIWAMKVFRYSIIYLMLIFVLLLVDHFIMVF